MTACPHLKMQPPKPLDVADEAVDDTSYDQFIDNFDFWANKNNSDETVADYKARGEARNQMIYRSTLLYVSMMSTEIASTVVLKQLQKKSGEVSNPFSKHIWKFTSSIANAPNTEEVFLNRVRSKLQETEKDDTKIKNIMDPIQNFLKSKDPAERKKAKKNTKRIVFGLAVNDEWPPDFKLIVDSLFDDPLKHDYMKQPWLALPIAVIMRRGSFKLFKRYGIQGLKLFEALRIKFETSISHCQVFHGDENTNEVGLKAMNTMWKDDIHSSKLALSEFPFRKDTDANNDDADGIFMKNNKSEGRKTLGKNLYLNKLWNKINTPQEPTYTSIRSIV